MDKNNEYEELKDYNYFNTIFQFAKESSGIAFTLSYVIMILLSMTYLYVLYSAFDIPIIKLLTLEDILATPIKNPNIMLAFIIIVSVFYLADKGNRLYARLHLKYQDTKVPLRVRVLKMFLWSPKSLKGRTQSISIFILICVIGYVISFASVEVRGIKKGNGAKIELQLADSDKTSLVTLLGTTSQFVIVYDNKTNQAGLHQNESVHSFRPVIEKQPETE